MHSGRASPAPAPAFAFAWALIVDRATGGEFARFRMHSLPFAIPAKAASREPLAALAGRCAAKAASREPRRRTGVRAEVAERVLRSRPGELGDALEEESLESELRGRR